MNKSKKRKRSVSEIFSAFQIEDIGRETIGENINEVLNQKFYSSDARKYNISFKEFKKIRSDQLSQMYKVYNEILEHNCSRLMKPNGITDVSIEAARKGTSTTSFPNDGFLALDQNDIYLIAEVAQRIFEQKQNFSNTSEISFSNAYSFVNNMESLNFTVKDSFNLKDLLPMDQICKETNVAERELYLIQHSYEKDTFAAYAHKEHGLSFLQKVAKKLRLFLHPEERKKLNNQEISY